MLCTLSALAPDPSSAPSHLQPLKLGPSLHFLAFSSHIQGKAEADALVAAAEANVASCRPGVVYSRTDIKVHYDHTFCAPMLRLLGRFKVQLVSQGCQEQHRRPVGFGQQPLQLEQDRPGQRLSHIRLQYARFGLGSLGEEAAAALGEGGLGASLEQLSLDNAFQVQADFWPALLQHLPGLRRLTCHHGCSIVPGSLPAVLDFVERAVHHQGRMGPVEVVGLWLGEEDVEQIQAVIAKLPSQQQGRVRFCHRITQLALNSR